MLSPRFPRFSEATAICSEKQLAEYRDINKAMLSSFLGTPETWETANTWEIHDSQEQKNVLNCVKKVSLSFVQSRGTSKYVPQYASQNDDVLVILKQLLEEMNSDIATTEATEWEYKKTFDELRDTMNEKIAASNQQHKEPRGAGDETLERL